MTQFAPYTLNRRCAGRRSAASAQRGGRQDKACPYFVQRVHDLSLPLWRTSCHARSVTAHRQGARVDASDTFKELQGASSWSWP